MSFAKRFVFETIRAARRAGTVGLFVIGLLAGSGVIAALSEDGAMDKAAPTSLSASATTSHGTAPFIEPSQPWSRVVGGREFERVTDVIVSDELGVMFAGVSVPVGTGEASDAMILRTDPHGFVHAQAVVSDPRIGSVSRAILDENGEARLIHWVGARPAFGKTDSNGKVVWSRVFDEFGESVWVDIVAADGGESLLAVANSDLRQAGLRIMRVDESGRVLWRQDLAQGSELGALSMADSEDGGALLAVEIIADGVDSPRRIELVRLDRHGRIAWSRGVFSEPGARMADADLQADGGAMLVHGSTAALYRFDGLGGLQWVREVPGLAANGRHLVTAGKHGAINVVAEPREGASGRRHWLAQFDTDGRLAWSHTRANRLDATLEAATMSRNGMLVTGGSLITATHGDTDMLMLTVGADGAFPTGYGTVDRLDAPGALADRAGAPVLAASLIVEDSMALRELSAAPAPIMDDAPAEAEPQVFADRAPELPAVETPAAVAQPEITLAAAPLERPAVRQVAADTRPRPVAALPSRAPAAQPAAEPAILTPVAQPTPVTAPSAKPDIEAIVEATPRTEVTRATPVAFTPPASRAGSETHSFACTFTCLADSDDLVRYPVTRLIEDADEDNPALFSLDVMAMDQGVCLATGGRVYDAPRLPPVCEMVD